jgi:hypothetical protein
MEQREQTLIVAGGAAVVALLYLRRHRPASSAASSQAVAGGTAPAQGPLSPDPWAVTGRPGGAPAPTPNPEPHLWLLSDGTTAIESGTDSSKNDGLDSYGLPVLTS